MKVDISKYVTDNSVWASNIYDTFSLDVPDDYEIVNIRVPQYGELFMGLWTNEVITASGLNNSQIRLIVRKKESVPVKETKGNTKMTINTTLYSNTQEVTAEQIYETSTLAVPEGYEVTDFRIPKKGDSYISRMWDAPTVTFATDGVYCLPLLIVKKSPPPMPPPYRYEKVVTIKDIYKTDTPEIPSKYCVSAFRLPEIGEMVLSPSYCYSYGPIDPIHKYAENDPRLILKLSV